jgi:retinaldehyde-binding protein 1
MAGLLSTISGETLEKAKKELNEDPETRAEMVDKLRVKIEEAKGDPEVAEVEFTRNDGSFLLRFLRARKFDVDRAAKLYFNYYKFRHKNAHVLGDMHPRAVKHVLDSRIMGATDLRRKDGSAVLYACPGRWNSETVPFTDIFRTMILLLDKLIEEEENQVHGISFINNLADVSFPTIFKLAQTEQVRRGMFVELLQDCFPGRFKGMHLVRQPWYISLVLGLVRPFMKQKMRDRFFMHGTDYTSLCEYFDPELLPPSLGGSGAEFDNQSSLRVFQKELEEMPANSPQSSRSTLQSDS